MESLFPGILHLWYFALLIPRVAVAALMLYDAKKILDTRRRRLFAGTLALLGVLIGVGLFTQVAALGAIIMAVIAFFRLKEHSLFGNAATLILMLATLLFLVIAGAGGLAFDLPY